MWSFAEKEFHIGALEVKAVQLALNTFLPSIMGEAFGSDNATVMAYLEKQGSMVSLDLCRLAQEVMHWSQLHMLTITARYITWKKNVLADQLNHPDQVLSIHWSSVRWVRHHLQDIWLYSF